MSNNTVLPVAFSFAFAVAAAGLFIYGAGKTTYQAVSGTDLGKEFLKESGYTKIITLDKPAEVLLRLCPKGYVAREYNAIRGNNPPSNVMVCVGNQPYILEK